MLNFFTPGNELLGKLRKMRMLADDDDEVLSTTAAKSQPSQQPAWMRTLLERCREWLDQLPAVCMTCYTIPFHFDVFSFIDL